MLRRTLGHPTFRSVSTIEQSLGFVVVEAHNCWSSFLRAYFLSSAWQARLADGTYVQHARGSLDTDAALTLAIHSEKAWLSARTAPWTRREEPTWHDTAVV